MQPPQLNMSEGKGTVPSLDVGEQEACPENQQDRQLRGLAVKLRQRLMPFQREGVRFALAKDGRCMIADEMGLGKTLQAISVAYMYREEWPLLIVVPSSLKYPWIEEMEKWVPELNPGDINLVENKMDVSAISRSKVTILGYGLLTTDAQILVDSLTRQSFRVVIVDESHYLKSRNAARSKILVPLVQKAKRAILLTGTPALGRPEELFMQIDALYPRKFGTWTDYAKKYCNAHYRFFGNRRQWDCRGASNLQELHQRLNEIMIRRLKSQVLTQLPPKIRQRIPFDLPKDGAKEAQASFEEWERLMKRLDSGPASEDASFTEVMSLITRMYKQTAIAKAGAVKDYIRMMLDNERLKFLVFAHHLTMLQACTEAVIEAKAPYIRIDGSVPSAERIHLVHRFQNDPETRVAILSIQAAGQGLTLTAASHVVFAELYWNPGHIKQAEDRAHRIGQTSSVHIHYLIAKGTFDTIMWGMLNRKEGVTGSTLDGRREYLKADIGDKDKWDFLNFAHAWTPSEALGREVKDHDDVFFSHFERDRQHDIRKFFTPNSSKEKKRRRIEEGSSPLPISEPGEDQGDQGAEEGQGRRSEGDTGDGLEGPEEDQDFAPLSKKIRGASPQLPIGRKRRSGLGSASPLVLRRLSEGIRAPPAVVVKDWSCGACTYANSALLPYCEMCATPRFEKAGSSGFDRSGSRIDGSDETEPGSGGLDITGGVGQPLAPKSPCLVTSSSDEEADPSPGPGLAPPAPRREDSEERGGEMESQKQRCEGAQSPGSAAPDRHTDESICDSADSGLPLHESLQFCASYNSDRIYLYTKEGIPLNCNFIPMDIKLDTWEDLPEAFGRQENRRQVQRFAREWSSLTSTKQRVVRRSGRLFHSPLLTLNDLTSAQRRQSITKRFLTKDDVAQASMSRAQQEGGTVRTVTPETFFAKRTPAKMADSTPDKGQGVCGSPPQTGYLQAVDSGGNPLCLSCQKPCGPAASWDGRFCGPACQEEFQVRSSQSYMRMRVLEAERGVCQTCGLDAHQLFLSVRDAPPTARKEMLENTWLSQLSLKELNEMIRNPVEGQFWQVDHIRPVYSGGGQCSLDNLQTLCTVCHKERTSLQAKERSQMKKGLAASKVASDITRFLIRK